MSDNVDTNPCLSCGSTGVEVIEMPPGHVHHAKRVCVACGRFLRWVPRPAPPTAGPPPAEVRDRIHPRHRPAPLVGSEAQVRYGRSVRAALLLRLDRGGLGELAAAARCVTDPGWWIANHGRTLAEVRWPAPHQMEVPLPTGSCPECGHLTYDEMATCSDYCADARAHRRTDPGPGRRKGVAR